MTLSNMTTDELYQRIRSLSVDAVDFDLDQQDYYVNEIRQVLDELDERIFNSTTIEE
jgi:hypothetical protein